MAGPEEKENTPSGFVNIAYAPFKKPTLALWLFNQCKTIEL